MEQETKLRQQVNQVLIFADNLQLPIVLNPNLSIPIGNTSRLESIWSGELIQMDFPISTAFTGITISTPHQI